MAVITTILTWVVIALASGIAALNILAPLTKTETDNKILAFLIWLHDILAKVLVPSSAKETFYVLDEDTMRDIAREEYAKSKKVQVEEADDESEEEEAEDEEVNDGVERPNI